MMNEINLPGHSAMSEKPRLNYYIRLESESSINSDEDSESVDSIQGRETELAQDSTDTDGTDDTDTYIEYEVASLSEENGDFTDLDSSSGTDIQDLYVAEEVIAAVLGDTSLEAWAPDGEDSYSSTTDSEDIGKTDFGSCALCKRKNNNPLYRFCEECFQVRKNYYPPRPKGSKKRRNAPKKEAVNVDNLRSCLKGLTQDSGVGSSQEFSSFDFKEIKVPEQHLNRCSSHDDVCTKCCCGDSSQSKITIKREETTNRKRKLSDNFSDTEVHPKRIIIEGSFDPIKEVSKILKNESEVQSELCIMCHFKIKDGIFLHGNSAHSCSCYKCALKIWKTTRRCPVCNRRVNNVVKLYTT